MAGEPSAPALSPAHQYVEYGQNVPITWVHDPLGTGDGGQSARAFRWSITDGTSWTSVAKASSTSTSRSLAAQPGYTMLIQARTYDQAGTASPWSASVTAVCLAEGEAVPAPTVAVTVGSITLTDGPGLLPALTVGSITLDGPPPDVPTTPALTVGSITLDGPLALTVVPDPGNPAAVGPGERVALTATLTAGLDDDATWTWRRVSGPTATLTADGPVCHLTGPSVMPPAQLLVLGVRATVGTQASPEAQVSVRVLPQISWALRGSVMVGRRVAPAGPAPGTFPGAGTPPAPDLFPGGL